MSMKTWGLGIDQVLCTHIVKVWMLERLSTSGKLQDTSVILAFPNAVARSIGHDYLLDSGVWALDRSMSLPVLYR